jgi:glycolate oxidase FAD binding subunit
VTSVDQFAELVRTAIASNQALTICGGGTRPFPGDSKASIELHMSGYAGVVDYRPEELVVRARSGTRLTDLKTLLGAEGQMLVSDPPVHGKTSTIGGLIATGVSGSRRPYAGAIRDAVLGVSLLLQDATQAEFGGQVMKNVAGYDVSRLVCGSFGMLGPILDVSLKVAPKPEMEASVSLECSPMRAKEIIEKLTRRVSGISASCYLEGQLRLRFSGSETAVTKEISGQGGESIGNGFWAELDNQTLASLVATKDLWRLSTDPSEPFSEERFPIADWGFGQRWLLDPEVNPRDSYGGVGHWTRVRRSEAAFSAETFHPLSPLQMRLMRRVKSAFDSEGLFNPGCMYPGL